MFTPTFSILSQNNKPIASINRRLTHPSPADPNESTIYDDASYELNLTHTTNQFFIRINTSSLFRSRVNVTVLTPAHWECSLLLDNTPLEWSYHHNPDGSQNIWNFYANITEYALPQTSLCIRLQISIHTITRNDTCAYILAPTTESNLDPTRLVHHVSDTKFSVGMVARHVSMWLALLLGLFVISAHISYLQSIPEPFERAFSSILPLLVILFPTIFDRTLFPRHIRFIVARLYRWKKLGWAASVTLLAPICFVATLIVHCIHEQNIYQSTIAAYLKTREPEYLLRALSRYPSRSDARYAYERITGDLRHWETETLHSYVSTITTHPLFKVAIDKAKKDECSLCSTKDSRELVNPLVWIASILPEAESHTEVNQTMLAYNLLAERPESDAKLQAIIFQLYFVDDAQRPKLISDLRKLLSEGQISLTESEVAQVATDHLAIELLQKLARQKSCSDSEISEVLKLFERIINARTSIFGNALQWLRPPDKMALYHFFMALSGEHDTEADLAGAYGRICSGKFYSRFKKEIFERKKVEGYYMSSHWRRGTPLGPTEDGKSWMNYVLRTLSKENWRY